MKPAKICLFFILLVSIGCSKEDDDSTPSSTKKYGTVSGIISDNASSNVIASASVILFSSETNQAVATISSTSDGSYSFKAEVGNYFIKVNAQGYDPVPPRGFSAVSFSVAASANVVKDFKLNPSASTNLGSIEGVVASGSTGILGAMVVASDGSNGYSAISDASGHYKIFNVPAGSYTVKAWLAGFNSNDNSASVTANTTTSDIDLALTAGASGSVSGSITFLATQNADVDVSLTHPETGETVPGLFTMTSGGTYTISNVPAGTFLARASYSNDGIVMDPDWVIKNGEPFVTVSSGSTTRDFSVTGAVSLSDPTNAENTSEPLEITTTTPTFTWNSYSSTSDYVIEVINSNGVVIWGGFSSNWTVKNISIPSSQTSITYNSDGNATEALQAGQVYRWRIYASKDAQGGASWNLISSSEDQRGLIMVSN